MALAFAASLAFANKANEQSAAWINMNGTPQQLQNDPCNITSSRSCEVILADDPDTVYQVFTSSDLDTPKLNGDDDPYLIVE